MAVLPLDIQRPDLSMVAAPEWFLSAIGRPGESRYFDADGARLHVLTWNWEPTDAAQKPAVLLVHGFRAHAHWWDPIAPWLARDFRVAALDFSGMGDSAARPAYGGQRFARDVLATISHLGLAPATVIGHSFGGSCALHASALAPGAIAHAIVVDSYFNFVGEEPPGSPDPGPARLFDSQASARARYRLVPDQSAVQPWLLEHVAHHSMKCTERGWTWKFDPAMAIREEEDGAAVLRAVDARVDYVHAQRSGLVDAGRAKRIVDALPQDHARRLVVMKDLDHHLPLEDPLALREVLYTLLTRPDEVPPPVGRARDAGHGPSTFDRGDAS